MSATRLLLRHEEGREGMLTCAPLRKLRSRETGINERMESGKLRVRVL
jgi:hypothetical protein